MTQKSPLSRGVRGLLSASMLQAAVLVPAVASAQPPGPDFQRHVERRLHDAIVSIGACAENAPGGAVLPATVDLDASVRGRAIVVRVVGGNFPASVRTCIERAATAAVVPRRDARFDQQASIRTRIPFRPNVPPQVGQPTPTTGPVVIAPPAVQLPALSPGQPIEVEWGGSWYPAFVVAVDGPGSVRIHYDGWSDAWDESVPYARVRFVTASQPPVPVPPAPVPPQQQPPTYPGNLIVNGGFEQQALAQGSWQVLPQIPGWFITNGPGFELQVGAAGTPFEGRQLLELDSHAPTSIGQDVNTQAGVLYELQIAFSARPGTGPEDNRVLVLWDGHAVGRLVADGRGNSDTRWTVFSAWVNGTGRRARLEIRDEGTPNSTGSYIDDVRLTPVR